MIFLCSECVCSLARLHVLSLPFYLLNDLHIVVVHGPSVTTSSAVQFCFDHQLRVAEKKTR